MAKVEFTCEQAFKDQIKEEASKRGLTVAAYVKAAVSDTMVEGKRKLLRK